MKRYTVTVNGKTYDVTVEENGASAPVARPAAPVAAPAAVAAAPAAPAPVATPAPAVNTSGSKIKVNSPMPGTILAMNVKEGDTVSRGQVLCILEAMKMENEITSPDAGTVTFAAAKGASVKTGDLLVAIA